jgi:cell shape-determining protein MreD
MTVSQQMVVISFFILIKQHFFVWSNSVLGIDSEYFDLMISAVISGILWLPIYYTLRYFRRKFQIS